MSLDFYLIGDKKKNKEVSSGIFIRENGQTKEITEREWKKRCPGQVPFRVVNQESETNEVYSGNITHNVTEMWALAGVYDVLYMSQGKLASEIIPVLEKGLKKMKKSPEKFKKLNPKNGWGSYDTALKFLEEVLSNCINFPNCKIGISK